MTEIDASSAAAALRSVSDGYSAAQTPHPTPAWYPPARAALGAIAFGTLYGPWIWHSWNPAALAAGTLAAIAFIAVHQAAVRPGGVFLWPTPPGIRRRRLKSQWLGMLCWGLGWLAGPLFGWAAGAVVSALCLGGYMLWFDLRENARIRAGLR